jgi:glycosyltransferase involved in cell wall biosynthesis
MPLAICFVSHSSAKGGAQSVLLETIQLLQERGVRCHVLLPEAGPFCDDLRRLGTAHSVISFPLWMARGNITSLRRIRTGISLLLKTFCVAYYIRRSNCNLVYSNTVTVCVGALAARLLRIPHIWHLHEFGFEDHELRFILGPQFSFALIQRLSAHCLCVSHALARKYRSFLPDSQITVLYPPMLALAREMQRAAPISPVFMRDGRLRCVIVGALTEGKGQEDAILAMGHLQASGVDTELLIVGDGHAEYRARLASLIQSKDLESSVAMLGYVSHPQRLMETADAVLICSRSEAFGRVTVEAMLSGRPVIGARAAATAELIADRCTGLLYTPGDPLDLVRQIRYLRDNPAVASRIARAAQRWAERQFSGPRNADALLSILTIVAATSG